MNISAAGLFLYTALVLAALLISVWFLLGLVIVGLLLVAAAGVQQ